MKSWVLSLLQLFTWLTIRVYDIRPAKTSPGQTDLHQRDGAVGNDPCNQAESQTGALYTHSVYDAHTQCSAMPLGENKHLIKQFRCASAEVDYMYLAQIIISGSCAL